MEKENQYYNQNADTNLHNAQNHKEILAKEEKQNKNHNTKKVALGPNTKR